MINLRIHTEFHFDFSDRGFGRLDAVVARVKALGQNAAAITDSTTFGHINWTAKCKAAGIKPILGATARVPLALGNAKVSLIAMTDRGLEELYRMSSLAASGEITPEILLKSHADLLKLTGTMQVAHDDVPKKLRGSWYADVSPAMPPDLRAQKVQSALPLLATSENRYPGIDDRAAFSLFGGSTEPHAQHILSEREARALMKDLPDEAFTVSDEIAKAVKTTLPVAKNMKVEGDLGAICRAAIKRRVKRWTKEYEARLQRELKMIRDKQFDDYFLIISDMMRYAKKHMLVGPARGSSAGSLVCYLADITDVDPIIHGLLFERFIDVTREDLPDIDMDFPDSKREMVIEYLQKKYGADNVVHIGTVGTLQPKSILRLVSKRLDIKMWEFQPVLDVMVERKSGDSRGELCLLDTLDGMEAGRALTAKFPQVRTATSFEGHAQNAGTHAAGIVVCSEPVHKYCTVNAETATAQIDKHDAEKLNLLKIDILGLRTLSVLEYALSIIPKKIDLNAISLEDAKVFDVINGKRWAGIFQIEGEAIQSLSKLLVIDRFSDIVALGALGRPGPLNSQGAFAWCERRMGRQPNTSIFPLCEEFVEDTFGIICYQEQVMQIGRKVGKLSWEDVTEIRKTMAKSKGEEFFNTFWGKFLKGALENGITKEQAHHIWTHLSTMGAWAFNKSHAVSYAIISYWCAYLKAYYPLQFATATLRYARDEVQTVNLLRELTREGIVYTPFDINRSRENWEIIDGEIIGGFINLHGFGEATAKAFVEARASKEGLTEEQKQKIAAAEVMYANVYPAETLYGRMYASPRACGYNIDKLNTIAEIDAWRINMNWPSEFFFIGRLADKVPRDLNEYVFQVKRVQDGKPKMLEKDTAYLNLVLEDDTGRIGATIGAYMYEEVGKSIVESGIKGRSWYVFKGRINKLRRVNITWAKEITETPFPALPAPKPAEKPRIGGTKRVQPETHQNRLR